MTGLLGEDGPVALLEVVALDQLLRVGDGGAELRPPRGLLVLPPVSQLVLVAQLMIAPSSRHHVDTLVTLSDSTVS